MKFDQLLANLDNVILERYQCTSVLYHPEYSEVISCSELQKFYLPCVEKNELPVPGLPEDNIDA